MKHLIPTILILLSSGLVGYSESLNYSTNLSLPSTPEKSLKLEPLKIIPLEGKAPKNLHPGMFGRILAFKNETPSGAAILTLDKPTLSILPGTAEKESDDHIHGKVQVTANAHSVYVSDGRTGELKRFDISSQKMIVKRSFPKDKRWASFWALTSSSATNTPLILAH